MDRSRVWTRPLDYGGCVTERFKGELTLLGSRNQSSNNIKEEVSSKDDIEKPKILDEPLSIDDDEIPF